MHIVHAPDAHTLKHFSYRIPNDFFLSNHTYSNLYAYINNNNNGCNEEYSKKKKWNIFRIIFYSLWPSSFLLRRGSHTFSFAYCRKACVHTTRKICEMWWPPKLLFSLLYVTECKTHSHASTTFLPYDVIHTPNSEQCQISLFTFFSSFFFFFVEKKTHFPSGSYVVASQMQKSIYAHHTQLIGAYTNTPRSFTQKYIEHIRNRTQSESQAKEPNLGDGNEEDWRNEKKMTNANNIMEPIERSRIEHTGGNTKKKQPTTVGKKAQSAQQERALTRRERHERGEKWSEYKLLHISTYLWPEGKNFV